MAPGAIVGRVPVLKLDRVTLGYNGADVVRGVSLEAMAGEVVGIIGPNGCGKSTLIRGVSRTIGLRSGRVLVCDSDASRLSRDELARLVAVVPQNPSLPPAFTVAELVLMGRTPHLGRFRFESDHDYRVAWEAMQAMGVEVLADRRIAQLSGGERQRVLFARALAQQPRVMLLDEPTAHLDINYQVLVMDLVRRLCHGRQLAVVVAVHDLNLAAQYCDRLVMLRRGAVYKQGAPRQVITADDIRAVFGVDVCVSLHPVNSLPATLIVPGGNGADGSEAASFSDGPDERP